MHRAYSLAAPLALVLLAACGAAEAPGPASGVEISVAPLTLSGVTDADYRVTITNSADEVVATRELSSRQYGDGAGSLAWVAPCDGDANPNTVTLELLEVYSGASGTAVVPPSTYQNPGPQALPVTCVPNGDVRVQFDLTILRQANQGFFDVAVTFDDIFCSAKLDCVDDGGDPLRLLFDASGARNTTVVVGMACTGGLSGQNTTLYRDELVVDCGGGASVVTVDPQGDGRLPEASLDGAAGVLYGAAVYRGLEQLGYDKVYWNVALGLLDAADCRMTTRATASDTAWDDLTTPAGTTWPLIDWNVTLTDGAGDLNCTSHPLNGEGDHGGVSTVYTTIDAPAGFPAAYGPGGPINAGPVNPNVLCDDTAECAFATCADPKWYGMQLPFAKSLSYPNVVKTNQFGDVYSFPYSGGRHFVRVAGSTVVNDTVLTGTTAQPGMDIDGDGNAHVCYFGVSSQLTYLFYDRLADTMTTEVVDPAVTGSYGSNQCDLAVDSDGVPFIVARDGGIRFYRKDTGGAWVSELVSADATATPTVKVAPDGALLVAYLDGTSSTSDVILHRGLPGAWGPGQNLGTVIHSGYVYHGRGIFIMQNCDGQGYLYFANGSDHYLWESPDDGASWSFLTQIDVGGGIFGAADIDPDGETIWFTDQAGLWTYNLTTGAVEEQLDDPAELASGVSMPPATRQDPAILVNCAGMVAYVWYDNEYWWYGCDQ